MLDAWAWALLHFLWQGALIAAVAEMAMRSLSIHAANVRYHVACGALVAMVSAPILTVAVLMAGPTRTVAPLSAAAAPASAEWTALLVLAWSLGVSGLLARTALGLWAIQRLRVDSIAPSTAVAAQFRNLADRMGAGFVQLRLVADATVPMAVGWLRPAVLLPASLLARLPADQLEALLLHELAHVRRMDWLINLAQSLAETLLFYHPAVWWLGRRIRHERELCCDEAVLACGSASLSYAKALAHVEDLRAMAVPAANGGDLMDRILNIVGQPRRVRNARWVLPTLVVAGLIGLTSAGSAVASVVELDNPVHPMDLDGWTAAEEEVDGDERPVAAEDVGARALQMLSDYLERGAQNLEETAERRHARKQARKQALKGNTQGSPPRARIRSAETPDHPHATDLHEDPANLGQSEDLAEHQRHAERQHRRHAERQRQRHADHHRHAEHDHGSCGEAPSVEADCLELPGVVVCETGDAVVVELGGHLDRRTERKMRRRGADPFKDWAQSGAEDETEANEAFEAFEAFEAWELDDVYDAIDDFEDEWGQIEELQEIRLEEFQALVEQFADDHSEHREEALERWAEQMERHAEVWEDWAEAFEDAQDHGRPVPPAPPALPEPPAFPELPAPPAPPW